MAMKHARTCLLAAAMLTGLTLCSQARAQVNARQAAVPDSVTEEFQSLDRVFNTLNAGDTVYTPFFPTWSVQDRGLKLRIFSTFRNHNIEFNADDPVYVIATPDQQEIADVRIGNTGFGKMFSKLVLARDLHQALLERKYEFKVEVPVGYTRE